MFFENTLCGHTFPVKGKYNKTENGQNVAVIYCTGCQACVG